MALVKKTKKVNKTIKGQSITTLVCPHWQNNHVMVTQDASFRAQSRIKQKNLHCVKAQTGKQARTVAHVH